MDDHAEATRHGAHRVEYALGQLPLEFVALTVAGTAAIVVAAIIVGLLLTPVPEPIISAPIRL